MHTLILPTTLFVGGGGGPNICLILIIQKKTAKTNSNKGIEHTEV